MEYIEQWRWNILYNLRRRLKITIKNTIEKIFAERVVAVCIDRLQ